MKLWEEEDVREENTGEEGKRGQEECERRKLVRKKSRRREKNYGRGNEESERNVCKGWGKSSEIGGLERGKVVRKKGDEGQARWEEKKESE